MSGIWFNENKVIPIIHALYTDDAWFKIFYTNGKSKILHIKGRDNIRSFKEQYHLK